MKSGTEWWLLAALLCAAFLSLGLGRYGLTPPEVLGALLPGGAHEDLASHIVREIRLPRILTAVLAGGVLSLAGATLQSVFKNPLVDPHVIGVTSGAAFGGTLAIVLGLPSLMLVVSTQFFGLLALALVFGLSGLIGRGNRLVVILAGIILSGFFAALVSLLQYLADAEEKLPNIVFWLMGSFATSSWQKFAVLAVPALAGTALLLGMRWHMNILALGGREAASLGVNVGRLRWVVLLLCGVLTAAQVAVSGSIGWIGLVAPHVARILVGNNTVRLLPAAFLVGALSMLLIDDVSRTLTSTEVPIGILTALMGAPVFGVLLYRNRRSAYVGG